MIKKITGFFLKVFFFQQLRLFSYGQQNIRPGESSVMGLHNVKVRLIYAEMNAIFLSLKKIEVPVLLGHAKLGPSVVVYMYYFQLITQRDYIATDSFASKLITI